MPGVLPSRLTAATKAAVAAHLEWIYRITSTRPLRVALVSLFLLALAAPAPAESLRLELLRPAGADPVLGVRTLRVFPTGEVPCAGAQVTLTLPGGLSTEERAVFLERPSAASRRGFR